MPDLSQLCAIFMNATGVPATDGLRGCRRVAVLGKFEAFEEGAPLDAERVRTGLPGLVVLVDQICVPAAGDCRVLHGFN